MLKLLTAKQVPEKEIQHLPDCPAIAGFTPTAMANDHPYFQILTSHRPMEDMADGNCLRIAYENS
jgi:hypothetical protein